MKKCVGEKGRRHEEVDSHEPLPSITSSRSRSSGIFRVSYLRILRVSTDNTDRKLVIVPRVSRVIRRKGVLKGFLCFMESF